MSQYTNPHSALIRGKSSSSLKDEPAPKKKSVKKFTAGKVSRNSSYGKNLNKLTKIKSNDSAGNGTINEVMERPNMNRSKSSGDVLRNKSSTKLTGLLTASARTKSLTNLKTLNPKLAKHKQLIDVKQLDSDHSEDSSGEINPDEEEDEEEVESFDDNERVVDMQGPSIKPQYQNQPSDQGKQRYSELSNMQKQDPEQSLKSQLYNATFLLSQSTGQERPVYQNYEQLPHTSNGSDTVHTNYRNNNSDLGYFDSLQNEVKKAELEKTNSSNSISSTSSNSMIFQQSNVNIKGMAGFTSNHANKPLNTPTHQSFKRQESYQSHPNMSSFSYQNTHSNNTSSNDISGGNNFNSFMSTQQPTIETRTQQRLWLQRENLNSLVDISESNSYLVTNATRLEFEKLSREFLNIRRYNNPMIRSLTRLKEKPEQLDIKKTRDIKDQQSSKALQQESHHSVHEDGTFSGDLDKLNEIVSSMWKKNCNEFNCHAKKKAPKVHNSQSQLHMHANGYQQHQLHQQQQQQHQMQYAQYQHNLHQQQQQQLQQQQHQHKNPMQYQPTTRAQQQNSKGSSLNLLNMQN